MLTSDVTPSLIVIRSADIHRAVEFYKRLGLRFDLHAHGNGPEHYSATCSGFVFEIYPQRGANDTTTNVRLGFSVVDVDIAIENLQLDQSQIVSATQDSEWGRRAVVRDWDGHAVELTSLTS